MCAECCDHGASVELKDVNRATSFTSVCKQTSASDPLPEDGYLHDSKCALVFNYDAVVEEGKEGEKEEDEEEKKNVAEKVIQEVISKIAPKSIGGWVLFVIIFGSIIAIILILVWYFKWYKPSKRKEIKATFSAFMNARKGTRSSYKAQIDSAESGSSGIEMTDGVGSSAVVAMVIEDDDNEEKTQVAGATGDIINTIMGKGRLKKIRVDGVVEIELFWKLARGSKAILYQQQSKKKKVLV